VPPVDALGRLTLVDFSFDHALADFHREPVDGRVVGQRQHVDGLDVRRAGIAEALRHAHARDDASDGQPQVGLDRRRGRERAVRVLEQQRRRADLRRESAARAACAVSVAYSSSPATSTSSTENQTSSSSLAPAGSLLSPLELSLAHR
jgi:hypothetical protein